MRTRKKRLIAISSLLTRKTRLLETPPDTGEYGTRLCRLPVPRRLAVLGADLRVSPRKLGNSALTSDCTSCAANGGLTARDQAVSCERKVIAATFQGKSSAMRLI